MRLAARFGAIIVPFAAVGGDDAYDIALEVDEVLENPVLGPLARWGAQMIDSTVPAKDLVRKERGCGAWLGKGEGGGRGPFPSHQMGELHVMCVYDIVVVCSCGSSLMVTHHPQYTPPPSTQMLPLSYLPGTRVPALVPIPNLERLYFQYVCGGGKGVYVCGGKVYMYMYMGVRMCCQMGLPLCCSVRS